jgi:rod shape determining protein RodA
MKNQSVAANLDWFTVLIYFILVILGWSNIFSTSIPIEFSSFNMGDFYGKQLIFICLSIPLITVILSIDAKIYEKFSLIFYGVGLVLLLGLFVFGKTIKGQTNWYSIGSFGFQPSEFVKTFTSLLLAKYLSDTQVSLKNLNHQLLAFGIIGLPILLILLQPDAGSAMIFISLVLVLNREGLPSWYLWTGFTAIVLFVLALLIKPLYLIGIVVVFMAIHYLKAKLIDRNPIAYIVVFVASISFILSVDFVFENVLESHQKDRINVLFNDDIDLKKEGYNLNQSMIAIGSGGLLGKGFMEGTQTKGGFVPEQHTDYIFTTVGEEWGFVGSAVVIGLFVTLLLRIIYLAERQKTKFSRVYGYCVATIIFTHFFVNITMLIKLFPTIGVPLPFFSYGGSSLWAFTILLFIFLKLDANKVNEW